MRWKILGFDQLRLLSSLLVLAGHARVISIGDFNHSTNSPLKLGFYWVTSLGHAAVLVFFVLSGYLIGAPLIESIGEKSFDLRKFMIKRLVRIWIVLIPSFFYVTLLNHFTCNLNQSSQYCSGKLNHNLSQLPPLQMQSLQTLISNLTFRFGHEDYLAYGGNLPLWSLNYEIYCYVLIAVLVSLIQISMAARRMSYLRKLNRNVNAWFLVLLLGWLIYANPPVESFYFFCVFGLGIFAGVMKKFQSKFLPWNIFFCLVVLQILILGQSIRWYPIMRLTERISLIDLVFASIFAVLLLKSPEAPKNVRINRVRSFFDFSFSLYVIHMPVIGFLQTLFEKQDSFINLNSTQEFIVMILTSILIAFAISILTEEHTARLRNFLIKRLNS